MDPSSLVTKGPFGHVALPAGRGGPGCCAGDAPGARRPDSPAGARRLGIRRRGRGRLRRGVDDYGSERWDPEPAEAGDFGASGAAGSEDESSRVVSACSGNELTESEAKHLEAGGSRDENVESKAEVEASSHINKLTDQVSQPSEAPKQDYIHVRARRGQATDSHSLAERARREKISERMKILQDLVPGCNKVIGKASVLDEIINYIQSLQHQVEFLSMKLEALSSQVNPSGEGFPTKDARLTEAFDTASGFAFTSQKTKDYGQGSPQEWLHMKVGGGI